MLHLVHLVNIVCAGCVTPSANVLIRALPCSHLVYFNSHTRGCGDKYRLYYVFILVGCAKICIVLCFVLLLGNLFVRVSVAVIVIGDFNARTSEKGVCISPGKQHFSPGGVKLTTPWSGSLSVCLLAAKP